jgi:hypothetical protein
MNSFEINKIKFILHCFIIEEHLKNEKANSGFQKYCTLLPPVLQPGRNVLGKQYSTANSLHVMG